MKFVLVTSDTESAEITGRPAQSYQQIMLRCPDLYSVLNDDDVASAAPKLLRNLFDVAEQLRQAAED